MKIYQLLLYIGASIAVSVGVSWALLLHHGNMPHKDAVPKEWFQQHLENEKEWRQAHTDAIKELHQDMKNLLNRLIEK